MNELLTNNAVFMHDGHAVTTSLKIAEIFGKKHKHVIDSIRKLVADFSATRFDDSEFAGPNFRPGSYLDTNNQSRPMYEITKDGFVLLAMGFTGAEAMKFKIAYINRFNEMEELLKQDFMKHILQNESYWFGRYPHWPPVRVLALAGKTYRAISDELRINKDRVVRAVNSMFKKGLLDPDKVAAVQHGPARKAALRRAETWGQPSLFALEVLS